MRKCLLGLCIKSVVLYMSIVVPWGYLAMSGKHLVLVVNNLGEGYWHLVGRAQRCFSTSYHAQDTTPNTQKKVQKINWCKLINTQTEKLCIKSLKQFGKISTLTVFNLLTQEHVYIYIFFHVFGAKSGFYMLHAIPRFFGFVFLFLFRAAT